MNGNQFKHNGAGCGTIIVVMIIVTVVCLLIGTGVQGS